MPFLIREINKSDSEELAIVTRGCMSAVLESIPEFDNSEELARQILPNFTFEQMSEMIRNDFKSSNHRVSIAIVDDVLAGQSLYSIKEDELGNRYGFCFSRYVDPKYRRRGIAFALLQEQMDWFLDHDISHIIAHTHVSNSPLQNLFLKFGFRKEGPIEGPWKYYLLLKDISE